MKILRLETMENTIRGESRPGHVNKSTKGWPLMINDYRLKAHSHDAIRSSTITGRMLDPSAAENQMSSISTFHPVSRIQGTTSTLQPVINGADLDQISMKPPTRAPTTTQNGGEKSIEYYRL
jgi:hypothetical protein